MTKNKSVLAWIDEMKALLSPDEVVWIDGSEEQLDAIRAEGVSTGEMIKLNEELLPGCYLHRTKPNDVARVEARTFICSKKEEDAGPTNHWMEPSAAYKMLFDIARDSYKGRKMYVIPYSMGPIGSPLAQIGYEVTDSIYVVLNMAIMTRIGQAVEDVLGDSENWIKGLHASCDIDEEKRYITHFPEDNYIISVNSAYGGNVLLGKKCFALRIASYLGKNDEWMAEHMLILGLQNPEGEIKYVTGAFPSACGKTNLAMLIPPKQYRDAGYKAWTLGDDIAWINVGPDGRLYAMNPEMGFFGVAPGTGKNTNPIMVETLKNNKFFPTLYTTRIRPKMLLSGRASRGTAKQIPTPKADPVLIRTQDSPLPQRTAPASPINLMIPQAYRFRLLFSVADVQQQLRWFISQEAGIMAYL